MGNCQAIDAATLVIQHPNGKVERFYSSVSTSHVMKANPGHYVALLISTTTLSGTATTNNNQVRLTRIKLLKPTETLLLGHVYRLVTTEEVMKGLRERKQAKVRQNMSESAHKPDCVKGKLGLEMERAVRRSDPEDNQVTKHERHIARTTTTITTSSTNNNVVGSATAKTRFWQPSLQSISEAAS